MKHATIIDIARKLNLSPSTVSRALNNHPDVRQETKDKVRKAARTLSYLPNPIAKSLQSSRTMTIGVIVPEIEHYFFSSAISGIEAVASRSNYTIILCQSNESHEREVENTKMLIGHRVAGVIVSISLRTRDSRHFQGLVRRQIPLVFFDRVCEDVRASKVVIDDYKSAHDAVTYLISKGKRNIAHLGGSLDVGIYAKRYKGYLDAVAQSGLPHREFLMDDGQQYEEHGYKSMDALLRETSLPDAIFTVNDSVAVGALQRIREAGLRIPEDVAIVGFSNEKITRLLTPPLTTVEQPAFEMGKKAAEILIETIEKKTTGLRTEVMPTTLIVRGST